MAPSVVDWANEIELNANNASTMTETARALTIERSISFFVMNFLLKNSRGELACVHTPEAVPGQEGGFRLGQSS